MAKSAERIEGAILMVGVVDMAACPWCWSWEFGRGRWAVYMILGKREGYFRVYYSVFCRILRENYCVFMLTYLKALFIR